MQKVILKFGKALNKAEQKEINGGNEDCFTPYLCYGSPNPFVPCGTCQEYNQLSQYCKNRVINSCF